MRISTKIVIDMPTGVLLSRDSFEHRGTVSLLKGATAAETQLQGQQSAFYSTLTDVFNTQFDQQSAILASLNGAMQPILAAGANQYGFSPAEDAAYRSAATDATAAQYSNAAKTLGQNISAASGNVMIPSGAAGQLEGNLAQTAAQQESSQQLGITEAGYAQGRSNYGLAATTLSGVASQYNPTGYAGSATSAGTSAFNSAETIQKTNAAASPWGAIGGILGGVAGSFLGPIGTSLGSSLGSAIGGAGSGSLSDLGGSAGAQNYAQIAAM